MLITKAHKTVFREEERPLETQASVWNGATCQVSGDRSKKEKNAFTSSGAAEKMRKLLHIANKQILQCESWQVGRRVRVAGDNDGRMIATKRKKLRGGHTVDREQCKQKKHKVHNVCCLM